MILEKGSQVSGLVTEVYNYGMFIELENGEKALLPKEYMYISKKKKLTEIFSVGYNISAKILSKKKDYFVLTQKEIKQDEKTDKKNNNIMEEKNKSIKKTTLAKSNIKSQKKQDKLAKEKVKKEERKQDKNSPSLNDLKKLTTIGNIKISLQKKNSITKLADEKKLENKEEKVFLPIPENFVEDMVANYEKRLEQLEEVKNRIKESGWLNET
ncbi:S1 RNA-binding domain-containing protein [Gemella sp. zg-1178]|uniref:S1 RNA-binding domain-containing protein n=1 Tax=Gemella sp. zg-1178 TaxID=2840372 RepID=UPI001C047302|nr:S1 RNA-binding domain-containing protein [Gemella sp. zg-1178]MBU0278200.1 S1 RNA-binding domain-containing protein [Gemella sp. zg-1178]